MISLHAVKKYAATCLVGVSLAALSAGVAFAAADGAQHVDSGVLLKDFLYRLFNFAILVGGLAYFVAKPLKSALVGRREGIEEELKNAREAAESAEQRFAEYDVKLTRAEEEIEQIKIDIREEAELEKQRIIAEAEKMAAKIKEDSGKTAENEIAKARLVLRQEAAELAVELARNMLKDSFNRDDQARLVEEYKLKVGELH
ncbi:MAG: ATP synthase F0 subunit B [Desulfuromonadaceae bacterium]|nr:ATP synthase F0 subunit B [Desulfuromonadaceae bacterium]